MMKGLKFFGQLFVLWLICWVSNWFAHATGLPVPGNVVGVLVLFALLALGVIELKHVADAADFLLTHLMFFFIPLTVGLMKWGHMFREHGWAFFAAIMVSTLVPYWVVGRITEWMHQRRQGC